MKKKIIFVLLFTFLFSLIIGKNQIKKSYAHYLELEEKGNYIVMTKNNNSLKRVESSFEEVKTSSKEANKTMEKNNVIVTEIKLRQANELEAREDVLVVEEDFTVAASGELDMDGNVIRNVINNPVKENNEDNRDTNVENNSDTEWNIDMIKAKYGDNMNVTHD